MRFGVVYDLSKAAMVAELGYDYIEGHVTQIAAMEDEAFEELVSFYTKSSIKVEACCVLFPGSLRLTGPEFDINAVESYLDHAFPRLKKLGVEAVVFGSGGARRVPEDFDRAMAWHQLIQVGRLSAKKAEENGLLIALEPLNAKETNIVITQEDGLQLMEDVEREAFMILSDFYHLYLGGESGDVVARCGERLIHTHIANPVGRISPAKGDGIDYSDFFDGLARAGYSGRISVECSFQDPQKELAETLVLLKELAKEAGI